jgi:hypothetical protein
MKEQTKNWIDAARILMEEPQLKVPCPECGRGRLVVKDEIIPRREKMIDRYLICDNCGRWNVITMELSI